MGDVAEHEGRHAVALEEDVFGGPSRLEGYDGTRRQKSSADGLSLEDSDMLKLDCGQVDMAQLHLRSKAVVQSFRNICLVLVPSSITTVKSNPSSYERESTGASSLSHLAAVIIGRNLEEWLDAEMNVGDEDEDEQGERAPRKIDDEKLEKLRECLEWIPMSGIW